MPSIGFLGGDSLSGKNRKCLLVPAAPMQLSAPIFFTPRIYILIAIEYTVPRKFTIELSLAGAKDSK
jgi:hypothetical protein